MFELIKAVKQVLLKTQRLEKESIMESHGNPGLDGCGQITISTYVDDSLNRLNELIKKHRGKMIQKIKCFLGFTKWMILKNNCFY